MTARVGNVAGALVATVVLMGCGANSTTVTETVADPSPAPPTTEANVATAPQAPQDAPLPARQPTARAGQPLTFEGQWRIRLLGLRRVGSLPGATDERLRKPRGVYQIAEIVLTNLGKRPVDLTYELLFSVVDAEGAVHEASGDATIEGVEYEDRWGSGLQPNQPTRGKVVFDIPRRMRPRYLRVAPTPDSNEIAFLDDSEYGLISVP